MKLAVGFVSNGIIYGGDVEVIPTGRSPKQISTILEALARQQMTQQKKLSEIIHQGVGPRRGVHYAYFCYQNGSESDEMNTIFRNRGIPLTIFTWRLNSESLPDHNPSATEIRLIKDFRILGEAHP